MLEAPPIWPAMFYRNRAGGLGASVCVHAVMAALVVVVSGRSEVPRLVERPIEVAAVPAEAIAGSALESPAESAPVGGQDVLPEALIDSALQLDDFTFDFGKVRASQHTLFPFLTAELPLLDAAHLSEPETARDTFVRPRAAGGTAAELPPLTMTDAEIVALVDRTWSRTDRWRSFAPIASMAQAYHPQRGRMPVLLRTYLDRNLLQPYFDGRTRDPRFWVMLGLAADHRPMLAFVREFARQHPANRATTELLFLLDEYTQGSRDTLLMLMATNPVHLQDTRAASAEAHGLATAVYNRYTTLLRQRGLDTPRALRRYYDEIRLEILSRIVATSPDGYGTADARYLAGKLLWDQNDVRAAMSWWRQMEPDGRGMYAEAITDLRRELSSPGGPNVPRVNGILGAEYRRWLEFSAARLRQFGYAFDTF
jgi:hypothetical protein